MGGGGRNFEKLIKFLGISSWNLREITFPMKFKTIIIPDESFFLEEYAGDLADAEEIKSSADNFLFKTPAYFTSEYVDTIDEIRSYARKNFLWLDNKKYYFFHGQKGFGEEKLEDYFKGKGYEIVRPERLELKDELNILANCESFASTVGSISHNVLFLPDKSEVILIPRYVDLNLNQYQQAVNQVHEQNVVYVDSALSVWAPSQNGLFYYIVSYKLKEYFGDNFDGRYSSDEIEDFVRYAKTAQDAGFPGNTYADKYYWVDQVQKFMKKVRQRKDIQRRYNFFFK